MAKKFGSGAAFKTSLEARLRKRAKEQNIPFSTLQFKFAMERLLARLLRKPDSTWLLKGGFAMDLRFRPRVRTTKDVDLAIETITGEVGAKLTAALRDQLQEAADHDLGDYVSFRIGGRRKSLRTPQAHPREFFKISLPYLSAF